MNVWKVLRLWLLYAVFHFDTQRYSVNGQAAGVIGGAGILVQRAAFCFNNNLVNMISQLRKPCKKETTV
ncbi:hypothetical protein CARUB_v10021493mg [Capsella rubella]|uniref:Secreted protein n=1 Tax=Capsella rubella TaxID=81985 RepID=R0GE15_9BRAS|nr:hypothetical protein CARUB_v10021493mg [Capsella rubella]